MRHMEDKCSVLEWLTDPNTRTFPEGEEWLVSFNEGRVGVGEEDRVSQAEGRTYVKSLKWQSVCQVQETDKKATTMTARRITGWVSIMNFFKAVYVSPFLVLSTYWHQMTALYCMNIWDDISLYKTWKLSYVMYENMFWLIYVKSRDFIFHVGQVFPSFV